MQAMENQARSRSYFIYEGSLDELPDKLKDALRKRGVTLLEGRDFFEQNFKEDDRLLLHGSLIFLKRALSQAQHQGFELGIVPTLAQKTLARILRLPSNSVEALDILLDSEAQGLDLLYAGTEPVFYNVVVGEAPPLTLMNEELPKSRFALFWRSLFRVRRLSRVFATLTTAKGNRISTVLSGVLIFNRENDSLIAKLLQESSYNDGQLRALIIAPRSLLSYLHNLLISLFPPFRPSSLPDSIALIKSRSLQIESSPALGVRVDGVRVAKTPIEFTIRPKAIKFCAPQAFWERYAPSQSEKETLKLAHLPQEQEEISYAKKPLALFSHASEQEYRELFASLREEARLRGTFLILMILSTMLASLGLFLNSASVIIGAMLLAPLMQPILSFAMGVLRQDSSLAYSALKTVVTGVFLVLASSMLLALLLPFRKLSLEMAGRLHPSLLDLLVAIIAGFAAAYAKNNSKISGSLVGVAIAVALVPPLSTAGIGLGWGEIWIFAQAFLLFLTNFVGIVLAAAFVFMILGFSPIHRAKKGLIYSLLAVLIVSIPLSISFSVMAQDARLLQRLEQRKFYIHNKRVLLERISIRHAAKDSIQCDLIVSAPLNSEELLELKRKIDHIVGKSWRLVLSQRIEL